MDIFRIGYLLAIWLFALTSCKMHADNGVKVSEQRKVEAYRAVAITSVAAVYFTQSDVYRLKIEGDEKLVKATTSKVEDGWLKIGFNGDQKKSKNQKNGVTIYLSAPDLKNVEFTGVGSFNCEDVLQLEDVEFRVEGVGSLNVADLRCRMLKIGVSGVGSVDVNTHCDELDARLDGVGSVTLSGHAGKAKISKGGVGHVDTENLKVGE